MMYLAYTDGPGRQARLFREQIDALDWLLTPESDGGPSGAGGTCIELEKIDLEPGFHPIHRQTEIPGELDHIR